MDVPASPAGEAPSEANVERAAQHDSVAAPSDAAAAPKARAPAEPLLPTATVLKVVKARTDVLQTKAAKDILCRAASIFTVYLASAANDVCRAQDRSTMKSDDVCQALRDVGMAEFVTAVKSTLADQQRAAAGKRKRSSARLTSDGGKPTEAPDASDGAARAGGGVDEALSRSPGAGTATASAADEVVAAAAQAADDL